MGELIYPEQFPNEEELRKHVEGAIRDGIEKLKEVLDNEKSDC